MKNNKEDAYKALDLINNWISNVDTKNSIALALATVVFGAACTKFGDKNIISQCPRIFMADDSLCLYSLFIICYQGLQYFLCGLSILFFLLSLKAKIDTKKENDSLFFFGFIASLTKNDYIKKFEAYDDKKITIDILGQVNTNSKICKKKMQLYNKGIFILILSIVVFLGAFFFV